MLKNNPYMKAYLNTINESTTIDIKKYQQIAAEIGGEYVIETNTIDCKGNKVWFKNNWLNENGSFDFKLINTNNNWSNIFYDCDKLTYLPEDFTIPEGITDCSCMFKNCYKLTHLPEDFTIPEGVTDCSYMFENCYELTHLPEDFTIPNTVVNCNGMFYFCESLTDLPDNFHIPKEAKHTIIFYDCDKLQNKDPEGYIMWEL